MGRVADWLVIISWNINYSTPSGHYMYRTVVTICTASLTFNNSTFCLHSVFMCFVWISEQTAIISLYIINWLVCITETECVYCAVRIGSLHVAHGTAIYSNPWIQIYRRWKKVVRSLRYSQLSTLNPYEYMRRSNFFVGTTFWQKVSFCNPTV